MLRDLTRTSYAPKTEREGDTPTTTETQNHSNSLCVCIYIYMYRINTMRLRAGLSPNSKYKLNTHTHTHRQRMWRDGASVGRTRAPDKAKAASRVCGKIRVSEEEGERPQRNLADMAAALPSFTQKKKKKKKKKNKQETKLLALDKHLTEVNPSQNWYTLK